MSAHQSGTVGRRHVFFIAGFDPKSPRYYHALYRREAARQSVVSGLQIEVGKTRSRPTAFSTAWTIEAGDNPVHTVFEILQWDDIVHAHWTDRAGRVLVDGIRTIVFGLRDGAVQRMFRLFRPPVYATFLPLIVLSIGSLLAAALGSAVGWALATAGGLPAALGWAGGLLASVVLVMLLLQVVHRIQITWLLRLVRFTHQQAIGKVPGLDERLSAFAARIAVVTAQTGDAAVDEILVVGHSVGASLATCSLARWIDLQTAAPGAQKPVLLSLGHCLPLLGCLTPAVQFRRDLQALANADIDWLDITAPIDWAAFPGVDPVAAAGLPSPPAGWHPRLLSPRFHRLFSAPTYARLKANRFKVHLQYLMAGERVGRYDYFAITAGAQTLRERIEGADSDAQH